MPALTEKSESELFRDLLLYGLRVKDERLNAVAAECLVRQGNRPAGRLVLEALREKNPPGYRVRVLAVLKRIAAGPGLEIVDVMDLNGLLFAKNKEVREAAYRFFDKPKPADKPGGSDQGAAPGHRDHPAATPSAASR
jgi:hypothetical protein